MKLGPRRRQIATAGLLAALTGCASEQSYGTCTREGSSALCHPPEPDEQIELALQAEDYPAMLELLTPRVCGDPDCRSWITTTPRLLVLYGFARAAQAGYNITTALRDAAAGSDPLASWPRADPEQLSSPLYRRTLAQNLGELDRAIAALAAAALSPAPPPSDLAAAARESGHFQQTLYQTAKITQCQVIYDYISADLAARMAQIDGFSACSFDSVLSHTAAVLDSLDVILPECVSCDELRQRITAEITVMTQILAESDDDASDSERTRLILRQRCRDQAELGTDCDAI